MSTQGRHERRHHYGNKPAAIVIAALLAACAVLLLAALFSRSGHASGPVETLSPGPVVTAVQPATAQPTSAPAVAVVPDRAAHREHVAHVAHRERLERLHADHVAHEAHDRRIALLRSP